MKLHIHGPINISINATKKRKRNIFSKKIEETKEIIYFTGNKYSYDKDGNPYGKGVFYSHFELMDYISKVTTIQD